MTHLLRPSSHLLPRISRSPPPRSSPTAGAGGSGRIRRPGRAAAAAASVALPSSGGRTRGLLLSAAGRRRAGEARRVCTPDQPVAGVSHSAADEAAAFRRSLAVHRVLPPRGPGKPVVEVSPGGYRSSSVGLDRRRRRRARGCRRLRSSLLRGGCAPAHVAAAGAADPCLGLLSQCMSHRRRGGVRQVPPAHAHAILSGGGQPPRAARPRAQVRPSGLSRGGTRGGPRVPLGGTAAPRAPGACRCPPARRLRLH